MRYSHAEKGTPLHLQKMLWSSCIQKCGTQAAAGRRRMKKKKKEKLANLILLLLSITLTLILFESVTRITATKLNNAEKGRLIDNLPRENNIVFAYPPNQEIGIQLVLLILLIQMGSEIGSSQ